MGHLPLEVKTGCFRFATKASLTEAIQTMLLESGEGSQYSRSDTRGNRSGGSKNFIGPAV